MPALPASPAHPRALCKVALHAAGNPDGLSLGPLPAGLTVPAAEDVAVATGPLALASNGLVHAELVHALGGEETDAAR